MAGGNFSFSISCSERKIPAGWVILGDDQLEKIKTQDIRFFTLLIVAGSECCKCGFNCLLVPRETVDRENI